MTEHVDEWRIKYNMTNGDIYAESHSKDGKWLKTIFKDELEARLNEYETLKAAFTIAIHLLGHADFKNGNTDPGGTIDEGEVHACRLMDEIKALVPQLYADILEGK